MNSTAFYTDQYELTMLQAALRSGAAQRRSVFEVFSRRLRQGRRYGVVAGTGRLLEGIERFRFTDDQLAFLSDRAIVDDATLKYLADYKFSGSVRGYAEGEMYFAQSPILTVEGTFAEACLLETYILSVLNYDSAVASAASRMTLAAGGRPCLEMGARRINEEAAVAASRAAYIAGFAGTSNLAAGQRYGIPTIGTSAHSFTLLHDDERAAFQAQIASLGRSTTLLVDTYDVENAVRLGVELAGKELGAVRLDSGDLGVQAREVRQLLDSLGNTDTKITVTSDLDEFAIAGLAAAPVDSYGVGTQLVVGSGVPTAAMVYKLVARQDEDGEWVSVAKASQNKASVGGDKWGMRRFEDDAHTSAVAEIVQVGQNAAPTPRDRELTVEFMNDGELASGWTGAEGTRRAAEHHRAARAELPQVAQSLSRGDAVLPTILEEL